MAALLLATAPAPAPTPPALAASVQQAAGVPRSQVTAVNVCSAPASGHAACAARALVLAW